MVLFAVIEGDKPVVENIVKVVPDIPENGIFSPFGDFGEDHFQHLRSFMMHVSAVVLFSVIVQRAFLCILFLFIRTAGSHSVAYHLNDVFLRHSDGHPLAVNHVIPVFPVMPVSSLVMEPSGGEAVEFLLINVGGPPSLKVFYRYKEFGRAVLGEIMGQSLHVETAGKTVFHDFPAMCADRIQMFPETLGIFHFFVFFAHMKILFQLPSSRNIYTKDAANMVKYSHGEFSDPKRKAGKSNDYGLSVSSGKQGY